MVMTVQNYCIHTVKRLRKTFVNKTTYRKVVDFLKICDHRDNYLDMVNVITPEEFTIEEAYKIIIEMICWLNDFIMNADEQAFEKIKKHHKYIKTLHQQWLEQIQNEPEQVQEPVPTNFWSKLLDYVYIIY